MGTRLRQLLNNLGTIILALLLALVVWIAATLEKDAFDNQDVGNVAVQVLNQPANAELFGTRIERVTALVRARESDLRDLEATELSATIDLAGVELGETVSVPVHVTTDNKNLRLLSWTPETQSVRLEAMGTITVPVVLDPQGEVAAGFEATRFIVEPETINVYGPLFRLEEIEAATAAVVLDGARQDIVERVSITLQNADGDEVADVSWFPDQVEAAVLVRERLGFKPDVEVVPDLRGDPPEGYRLEKVSVDPPVVTLSGPPAVLDGLPGFVETLPISITNVVEDLALRTTLTLPTSVVVVSGNVVTVTVEVLPIQVSRTMTATVQIRGVPPERIATAIPSIVRVIVEGPDAILSELKPEDIQITAVVLQTTLGVHRVVPEVLAPPDVDVVSISPEAIEVTISLAPRPTPTPTLTPTLTITPTLTVTPAPTVAPTLTVSPATTVEP
jgi:YbbR domain-containing protein